MADQNPYQQLHPDMRLPGLDSSPGLSIFLFGGFGTRKTSVAATFPAPLFLSCGTEHGDRALPYVTQLYGVPVPPIFTVPSPTKLMEYIDWIVRYAKQAGFGTIVFDSLTYYADLWMSTLMSRRREGMRSSRMTEEQIADALQMRKQDWGAMETHLMKDVVARVHGTGLNAIWIVVEKKLMENDEKAQSARQIGVAPYITGATAGKLPGLCDMIVHADKKLVADKQGKLVHEITWSTDPTMMTKDLRHRFANSFPEGRIVDPSGFPGPTFWGFYSRIPQAIYVPDHIKQQWSQPRPQ